MWLGFAPTHCSLQQQPLSVAELSVAAVFDTVSWPIGGRTAHCWDRRGRSRHPSLCRGRALPAASPSPTTPPPKCPVPDTLLWYRKILHPLSLSLFLASSLPDCLSVYTAQVATVPCCEAPFLSASSLFWCTVCCSVSAAHATFSLLLPRFYDVHPLKPPQLFPPSAKCSAV